MEGKAQLGDWMAFFATKQVDPTDRPHPDTGLAGGTPQAQGGKFAAGWLTQVLSAMEIQGYKPDLTWGEAGTNLEDDMAASAAAAQVEAVPYSNLSPEQKWEILKEEAEMIFKALSQGDADHATMSRGELIRAHGGDFLLVPLHTYA